MGENDTLDPAHMEEELPGVAGRPTPEKEPLELSEDGNIVKSGDKTYIRQEALHQAREERDRYKSTVDNLAPLMPEFEEFIENKRNGRTAKADAVTRGTKVDNYDKDELEGVAIALGLTDEQGNPDLRRAAFQMTMMERIAEKAAGKAVQPIAEGSARDKGRVNRANATARQFVDGAPVADPKYLEAAFSSIPEEMAADETVAGVMQLVAAGLEYLDLRKSGKLNSPRGSRREPMFVEGGSGRVFGQRDGELSALDRAAAKARGKTPEQWAKSSKLVNTDILEDLT